MISKTKGGIKFPAFATHAQAMSWKRMCEMDTNLKHKVVKSKVFDWDTEKDVPCYTVVMEGSVLAKRR